jgi:hypothetical protein
VPNRISRLSIHTETALVSTRKKEELQPMKPSQKKENTVVVVVIKSNREKKGTVS